MTSERRTHPDAEALALFAEGQLRDARRTAMLEHLDGCEECMTQVALAMETMAPRGTRFEWTAARIAAVCAAAAAALVLLVWPLLSARRAASPMARLVAAAPRSERSVEPRLTGGFGWAEYRGGARAERPQMDPVQMKLTGIAGELVEQAAREPTPQAQHAAAVAMLLVQRPGSAAEQLEAVPPKTRDAKLWSDLAAARYATAADLRRPSLYPQALAAADEALRIDPALPEALFNRALILERLRLLGEARRAWQRYLEVDATSPWAAEARARLAELPAATAASRFERDRPRLENAAARGDLAEVRTLLAFHAGRARAFAETEYLGAWGASQWKTGEDCRSSTSLVMARTIGTVLAEGGGEGLLRDAVEAIDRAPAAVRRSLAEGHAIYREARLAYSRDGAVEARPQLLRAAELLERGGDPVSLMARHYAASALLASGDVAGARRELHRLTEQADRRPAYVMLRAHAGWELARTYVLDDDPAAAIPILVRTAALFRRGGDAVGGAFVESMLASALTATGQGDRAWEARIRAFESLSREGAAHQLTASLAAAKRAELLAGRPDAALALARLDALQDRAGARTVDVVDALVYRAMLESQAGNAAEARAAAHDAAAVAARMEDAAVRARLEADAAVAAGAALAVDDPRNAVAPLTRAIDFYRARGLPLALGEPLLLRARCTIRNGDADAAARDLEEGIALIGRRHERAGANFGSGALRVTEALFEEAVRLALVRGDEAAAFAIAERSHGAALALPELQRRLAGSGTVVLEAVALPDELVLFAVSERDVTVSRRPFSREALAALAKTALDGDGMAAATLYDALIRPAETLLAGARRLIVVPDAALDAVPFAALYDRTRQEHLVERLPVSIAVSAASLERSRAADDGRTRAVAAVLSGGDDWQKGLPAAADEIRAVRERYPRTAELPPAASTFAALRALPADVLHIAGHTSEEPGAGDRVLVLTGASGAVERVSWSTIAAARPLRPRVVVLAACETLRRPASPLTHAPSLGAAFSAAGAADVIGTLTLIADRDARTLFEAIHGELAAGAEPAEAVRSAQLLALRQGRPDAWRGVTVLTRRIAPPSR